LFVRREYKVNVRPRKKNPIGKLHIVRNASISFTDRYDVLI
jgi:hypothetical protein